MSDVSNVLLGFGATAFLTLGRDCYRSRKRKKELRKSLKAELRSLLSLGEDLEFALNSEELFQVKVDHNYITVYESNCDRLASLANAEDIIKTYMLIKSLIDTLRTHNENIEKINNLALSNNDRLVSIYNNLNDHAFKYKNQVKGKFYETKNAIQILLKEL